ILRRTGAFRGQELRIDHILLRRAYLLDNDAVPPGVAEIVDIAEGLLLPRRSKDIGQVSLIPGSRTVAPFVLGNIASPADAPGLEFVEMSILPFHHALKNEMEVMNLDVGWNFDAAQHLRLDAVERRLALIEERLYWLGHINRTDLVRRFGVSMSQASGDGAR